MIDGENQSKHFWWMIFDDLVKPGWKNFLLMLLLWQLGVCAYIGITANSVSFGTRFLFYQRHSWPNFFYTYVMAIWVIPRYLFTRRFLFFLLFTLVTISAFTVVRYINSLSISPDYFYQYDASGHLNELSSGHIIWTQVFRALQFFNIALTYRGLLEMIIANRRKKELETEKLRAELALLRNQLNPHFLFNTINDIYYLIITHSSQAGPAVLKLSELLRYVLQEKDDMVPINREIDYLRRFIELHRFRFPDDVVDLEITTEAENFKHLVPSLLLSTFAENAFKHGLPGTQEHPVRISLKACGDKIHYDVTNLKEDNLFKDPRSGIGLENLQKRLSLLYPGKHELKLKDDDENFNASLTINFAHD